MERGGLLPAWTTTTIEEQKWHQEGNEEGQEAVDHVDGDMGRIWPGVAKESRVYASKGGISTPRTRFLACGVKIIN